VTADGYELYYWPGIQGRGEFVRLALEFAGVAYVDVARRPKGVAAMMKLLESNGNGLLPFAPPFLKSADLVIAQTATILAYLGPRHGLVPDDEESQLRAQQLQLTIADLVAEAHDTHHPIAGSLYYEEQKREARRRSTVFVEDRIPKYLGYLEKVLDRNGGQHLVGDAFSYPDLSAFQVLTGLEYAFPHAMARLARRIPLIRRLRDEVAQRPRISAYLESDRRLPFNEQGIFRHYPELDERAPARVARSGGKTSGRRERLRSPKRAPRKPQ
jgi:glutathione S-transferase